MDRYQYEAADEALHWVRASFLQMTRYAESFVDYADTHVAHGGDHAHDNSMQVIADAHFLLNACAQAEKALSRVGRPLPESHTTTIRCLRNIHEHWEQHKQSFESRKNLKSRAGRVLDQAHPGALPWNFRFDITGTWISALRIEDLWSELVVVERELHALVASYRAGLNLDPVPPLPERGEFRRRESRVLGIAMSTQTIVIDNTEWGAY